MASLELLTPKDVFEEYGISRQMLNKLVKAGRIKPTFDSGQPGLARLYSPESIESYQRSRDNRGGKRLPG